MPCSGHLTKKHEEKELGLDLDEYFPPDSCAVALVAEDKYLDRIDRAVTKSAKKISKAIDQDDFDKLKQAVADAGTNIDDAIDS